MSEDDSDVQVGMTSLTPVCAAKATKSRGKNRQWESIGNFSSIEEALKYISDNPTLRFHPDTTHSLELSGNSPSTVACHVTRRSSNTIKPDKSGIKKINFACKFGNSHGCPVRFLVKDSSGAHLNASHSAKFELFAEIGVYHDHSTYLGRQTNRDMKVRVEALADTLTPRQIRRQVEKEGMQVTNKDYDQVEKKR